MIKKMKQNFELVNLYFKRDKMYNFYSKNNIKYSDVTGKIIKILPVLLLDMMKLLFTIKIFFMKIG